MKLVAIEKATGKRWPVKEASFEDSETWIAVQTGKQSYVYERVGERYTLHVSTCTFDKHGQEILVGDEVMMPDDFTACVIFDGELFWLQRYANKISTCLTPELAATMEVVE